MLNNVHVVTSMNDDIYHETGEKMIQSFLKHWDSSIDLYVFFQKKPDEPFPPERMPAYSRVHWIDQMTYQPLVDFIERNKDRDDQQDPKELFRGAIRFSYKTFAITNALIDFGLEAMPRDLVIWLDADTETFNPVSREWIDDLLPEGKYTAFLGRTDGHERYKDQHYSECGFVIYDVSHIKNEEFARTWQKLYTSDKIFEIRQWHDSYVYDRIRESILDPDEWHNMTPWGKDFQHVWLSSELATRIDHMKGDRKKGGKSWWSDLSDFVYVPPEIQARLFEDESSS